MVKISFIVDPPVYPGDTNKTISSRIKTMLELNFGLIENFEVEEIKKEKRKEKNEI